MVLINLGIAALLFPLLDGNHPGRPGHDQAAGTEDTVTNRSGAVRPPACAGLLTFEVHFLAMKEPSARALALNEVAPPVLVVADKIPPDDVVLATLRASAPVGRKCHAEAQLGKVTVAFNGYVREVRGDEVQYEVEPSWDEKEADIGHNLRREHIAMKAMSGKWFVMSGLVQRMVTATGKETMEVRGVAVRVTKQRPEGTVRDQGGTK